MRLLFAILLGKSVSFLTKYLKIGGGSAAPGLYALKICPDLVEKLSSSIPRNVVITGTNGKTTTAKILAHFAKESGLKIIRNHTGSNLERGIASALIHGVNLSHPWGGLNRHLGIWELDEAALNTVAPELKPEVVVFLNVFRDQLDRYGEIDTVVKKWCQTLQKLDSNTLVLVNGDDANTSKLADCFKRKVQKFGIKDYKIIGESIENLKEKGDLDFEAKNVKLNGLDGSSFLLQTTNYQLPITLPLPGIYHIYDALAAFACAHNLNLPIHRFTDTLTNYTPAFGRVEKLDFGYIFLIKNPAGATQVFETIAPNIKPQDKLLLVLNDNLADGTDVSWIWDAAFERLFIPSLRATAKQSRKRIATSLVSLAPRNDVFVSGTRSYDLANRLKYAGFSLDTSDVEPNLQKAFREARKGLKGRLFILPTYTAMLELQSILAKSGLKKYYWKEEL